MGYSAFACWSYSSSTMEITMETERVQIGIAKENEGRMNNVKCCIARKIVPSILKSNNEFFIISSLYEIFHYKISQPIFPAASETTHSVAQQLEDAMVFSYILLEPYQLYSTRIIFRRFFFQLDIFFAFLPHRAI